MNEQHVILITLAPALVAAKAVAPVRPDERRERAIAGFSGKNVRPAPDQLHEEFPFLADAIVDHALGEASARGGIDHRTRQLATVAAFAATGNRAQLKIHAGYALNVGVSQDELKEIVYLTAVHAGFSRAIDAARALSELFAERWEASQPIN